MKKNLLALFFVAILSFSVGSANAGGVITGGTDMAAATGTLGLANGGTNGTTAYGSASNLGVPYANIKNYGAISDAVLKSSISTTAGSTTVTISGLTTADIGKPIVFMTPKYEDIFQTTISNVSGSTITLADALDVTATGRVAYYGTDNTTAINAAIAAAKANKSCLFIAGGNYFYNNSTDPAWTTPCIVGEGQQNSFIYLGAGKFLLDTSSAFSSMFVENIATYGGKGAIRSKYSGTIIQYQLTIKNNYFKNFSGAAISMESGDYTYMDFEQNTFYGLNSINTTGIAFAGSDEGVIIGNAFLYSRYGIKLGRNGEGIKVHSNDFIQFQDENTASSYRRASIWIVPDGGTTQGLDIAFNKFGNENLDTEDVRVLIADSASSGAGLYFGDTTPLTTASTGTISQLSFHDNRISGGVTGGTGSGLNPIFYSYTPNIRGCHISANIGGTYPGFVLQFDDVALPLTNDYTINSNVFGPFFLNGYSSYTPDNTEIKITNALGYLGAVVDPTGDISYADPSIASAFATGSSSAGYANLLTTPVNSFNFSSIGGGSKVQITDADGGTDAVTYSAGSVDAGNEIYRAMDSTPTLGALSWVEIDIRRGSTGTSMDKVVLQVADGYSSPVYVQKYITLPSSWKRYKIPFAIRVTPTHTPPNIQFKTVAGTAIGETVDIGRVRVYTASEPLSGGKFLTNVTAPAVNTSAQNTWTYSQAVSPATVTDSSGTFTPIFSTSNTFKIALVHGETTTIANPSGTIVPGTDFTLEVKQSSTGGDTVTTWGSYYKFPNGLAPALSTTASYTDVVACHVSDATHIFCSGVSGFAP